MAGTGDHNAVSDLWAKLTNTRTHHAPTGRVILFISGALVLCSAQLHRQHLPICMLKECQLALHVSGSELGRSAGQRRNNCWHCYTRDIDYGSQSENGSRLRNAATDPHRLVLRPQPMGLMVVQHIVSGGTITNPPPLAPSSASVCPTCRLLHSNPSYSNRPPAQA